MEKEKEQTFGLSGEEENGFTMKDRLFILKEKAEGETRGKLRVTTALALLGLGPVSPSIKVCLDFIGDRENWKLERKEEPNEWAQKNIINAGHEGEAKLLSHIEALIPPESCCFILYPKTKSLLERYQYGKYISGLPDGIVFMGVGKAIGEGNEIMEALFKDQYLSSTTRVVEIKTPFIPSGVVSNQFLPLKDRPSHILEYKRDKYYCLPHILQALMYRRMTESPLLPVILYNVERYAAHYFEDPAKWVHVLDIEKELRTSACEKMIFLFLEFIQECIVDPKANNKHSLSLETWGFKKTRDHYVEKIKQAFVAGIAWESSVILKKVFRDLEEKPSNDGE